MSAKATKVNIKKSNNARLIKSTFTILPDGSVSLSTKNNKKFTRIKLGPKYFGSVLKRNGHSIEELTVSPSRNCCALMVTKIVVGPNAIERKVRTEFVDKVIREDTFGYSKKGTIRTVTWRYPNGITINANYNHGQRILEIHIPNGKMRTFKTTVISKSVRFFRVRTTAMDEHNDVVSIYGLPILTGVSQVTYAPEMTNPVAGYLQQRGYTVECFGIDIARATYVPSRYHTSSDTSTSTVTSGSTMTTTTDTVTVVTVDNPPPFNTVVDFTVNTSKTVVDSSPGGSTTETNEQQKADGSSISASRTTDTLDGSVQEVTYKVTNNNGDSTTVTVTYNADGTTTTTVSDRVTNPDGTITYTETVYDKDGNVQSQKKETSSKEGNDTGNETAQNDEDNKQNEEDTSDTTAETSSDDDKPVPTGSGMPSDDGTDPTPRAQWRGVLDQGSDQWFQDEDPFMSGILSTPPSSPLAPRNPGDPIERLGKTAMDLGDGETKGGTPLGGQGDGLSVPVNVNQYDPENNPRAFLMFAAKLAGNNAAVAGAAQKIAAHW